jgi:Tfp pilus assembly protein PilN
MLTENEEAFLVYWRTNRQRQRKLMYQLLVGLPLGLLLGGIIAANFYSGWYKEADAIANGPRFNPVVLVVALLLIAVFVGVFSKRFQWDQREQKYRELLTKKEHFENTINQKENS